MLKLKVFGLCVNYIICSLDFRYTETVVRRCSSEQVLLKNLQCWSFRPYACNLLKKRLQHKCFFVKFAKSIRTSWKYRELSLYCIWEWWIVSWCSTDYWLSSVYFILLRVFRFFLFLSLFYFFCGYYLWILR